MESFQTKLLNLISETDLTLGEILYFMSTTMVGLLEMGGPPPKEVEPEILTVEQAKDVEVLKEEKPALDIAMYEHAEVIKNEVILVEGANPTGTFKDKRNKAKLLKEETFEDVRKLDDDSLF